MRFQDRSTGRALDVLGFVILGDEARLFVFAGVVFAGGNFGHGSYPQAVLDTLKS
jgi:hypothetical protein